MLQHPDVEAPPVQEGAGYHDVPQVVRLPAVVEPPGEVPLGEARPVEGEGRPQQQVEVEDAREDYVGFHGRQDEVPVEEGYAAHEDEEYEVKRSVKSFTV